KSIDSIRIYLQEIERTPLLGPEDEFKLASQVKEMACFLDQEKLTTEEKKTVKRGEQTKQKWLKPTYV
ncbi:MAG: sigma-70 factor domain-containing protein, partial [cyanobacterium endosymbiont of Rhopalodia inflata]